MTSFQSAVLDLTALLGHIESLIHPGVYHTNNKYKDHNE